MAEEIFGASQQNQVLLQTNRPDYYSLLSNYLLLGQNPNHTMQATQFSNRLPSNFISQNPKKMKPVGLEDFPDDISGIFEDV